MIYNSLVLLVSGSINYWVLNQLNLINFFDKRQQDEKYALFITLGFVNVLCYELIRFITNPSFSIYVYYIMTFILAFIIEYVFLGLHTLY